MADCLALLSVGEGGGRKRERGKERGAKGRKGGKQMEGVVMSWTSGWVLLVLKLGHRMAGGALVVEASVISWM